MSYKISKRAFYPLLLLLIPLLGMMFSTQVNWSLFDFIVMGVLLLMLGLAIDVIRLNFRRYKYRWIFIPIVVLFFIAVWIELSVGVFGTPFAGS